MPPLNYLNLSKCRALTQFLMGEEISERESERGQRSVLEGIVGHGRQGKQYSPDLESGAELIDFVSRIGQTIRSITQVNKECD